MSGCVMLFIAVPVWFSVVRVCALENIALFKTTWQKHPWPNPNRDFGSENAVDGMYSDRGTVSQCTINDVGYYTAEWRVDLGRVFSISYIKIFYRTDNSINPSPYVTRMAGFSLYVSNTTSKYQGYLCYKDQSRGTPSVNQTISCSIIGRYVIYYNERSRYNNPSYLSQYAYNELCEVEVFGCNRSYGECCQNPCPINCLNGECDAYTGQCSSCLSGYYGPNCTTECPPGYYGNDCSNQCSPNCYVTRSCKKSTGQCEGGCMRGWTGDTCDQMCVSGYYGKNCSDQCSLNCDVIKSCDRVTGNCDGGCKPGWAGTTCDQVCEPGYYGKNCSNQCSINCDMIRSCNRFTGECDGGCKPGWSGIHCDQECMMGYYGKNCSNQCSAYCNVIGRCDRITGRCDGGCKPRWKGETCDQKECDSGYFGPECRSKCGYCLESKHCHHINGSCLSGCLHGYRGDLCNETCPSGLFGLDCTNRCDTYCSGNKSCDPVMGICKGGCKNGLSGLMCSLDGFSNQQPCEDNSSIVIGVVLAVVIVLIGSVFNYIYWRRNTVINAHARHNHYDPKAENEDRFGNTSQHYTELGDVNKSSNYDELHNF